VKWVIEIDGSGATLVVTRTCGHVDRLWYSNHRLAENEADEAALGKCLACRNVDRKKRGDKWLDQEIWMST